MMMMGSGMLGMMVLMVLFWLLIIGLALWFLGRIFPIRTWDRQAPNTKRGGSETAMDVVMQRYARGEITRAEYEEIRRLLTGPAGE